jgi:hypothetical protein
MEDGMREPCRLFAVAAVCAVALAGTASMGVSSAAAADWQQQTHIEGEMPRPNLPLLGASCPSTQLCVVVGELDSIVSSTNPTGGPSAWRMARPTGEAETDCHESWVPHCPDPKGRRIRGVSCPSAGLCVAVTGEGYVYSSTNPTGSGNAWRVADIDGDGRDTHLLGVSCPTASLCVAVSGERYTSGKVLTSTNPTGPASAWKVTQLDETLDLRGVSCGTPTLCVAVAEQGRLLVSTDPTGGASAWRELGTPGGPGDLQGVSCAATVLCVAGNAGGNLLSSANPTAASTWEEADGGSSVQVTGVSCLPSKQCLAVDNNGDALASNDPTDGRGSWSLSKLIPYTQPASELKEPLNGLFGVSCVSSSFCAIAGADGQIFTSANPFAVSKDPPKNSSRRKKHGPKRPKTTIAKVLFPNMNEVRNHRRVRFGARFFANGPVRRFECKVTHHRFRPCRSPFHFKVGSSGVFELRIRAVGRTGLRGPVAIQRLWTGEQCTHRRYSCLKGAGTLPIPHG